MKNKIILVLLYVFCANIYSEDLAVGSSINFDDLSTNSVVNNYSVIAEENEQLKLKLTKAQAALQIAYDNINKPFEIVTSDLALKPLSEQMQESVDKQKKKEQDIKYILDTIKMLKEDVVTKKQEDPLETSLNTLSQTIRSLTNEITLLQKSAKEIQKKSIEITQDQGLIIEPLPNSNSYRLHIIPSVKIKNNLGLSYYQSQLYTDNHPIAIFTFESLNNFHFATFEDAFFKRNLMPK